MIQREEGLQKQCNGYKSPSWVPSGPAPDDDRALSFLVNRTEGAVVTHAHLDHTAGLVMASPNLRGKLLVGSNGTLNGIRDHLFNNVVWPDLCWPSPTTSSTRETAAWVYQSVEVADTGPLYKFKTSNIQVLAGWSVPHTEPTTAWLVGTSYSGQAVLFFGDNGPGLVTTAQWATHLHTIFTDSCGSLGSAGGRLVAIFIEVSYPSGRETSSLYGHLTPELMLSALDSACASCVNSLSLAKTHIVIIHRKPVFGSTSGFNASGAAAIEQAIASGMSASALIAAQVSGLLTNSRPSCLATDLVPNWLHLPEQGQILNLTTDPAPVAFVCNSGESSGSSDNGVTPGRILLVTIGLALCVFGAVVGFHYLPRELLPRNRSTDDAEHSPLLEFLSHTKLNHPGPKLSPHLHQDLVAVHQVTAP
eukprot:TRINITY_DN9864_c0_g1_i2.p1 TRINITY_DN9864_c0_g1~~TRINITY_DN9864_c0_g1_i2.p1  ORF type:complete len:419 (+),score=70.61 TRINITY_DN9864_c0_g1_i2:322-1578(+)